MPKRSAAGLAACCALAALCACDDGDVAPKNRVVPITLDQMLRTYQAGAAHADHEYGGRMFAFSARVVATGRDEQGHPRLEFRGESETGGAVCVAASDDQALAALAAGALVRVQGKVVGIKTGSATVVFSHCALADAR